MKNNTTIKVKNPSAKTMSILNKMIQDKETIVKHIQSGGKLKDLESKGFKFAKPL